MNYLFLASFNEIAQYALYILLAVLVLLVMITIHEFGHFITGKIFGFGIEEFSIGFGPKIFGKTKKNGEKFSIRVIPLGGFCAFKGEDADDEDPSAFNNKKPWQRIIVLVSGAFMNYVLALVAIIMMFGIYGSSALMVYKTDDNVVGPATSASFYNKDVIITVEGKDVYLVTDVMNALSGKKSGEAVLFGLYRNGKFCDEHITLKADADFKNLEDSETLCRVLGVYYEKKADSDKIETGFRTTGIKFGFFKTIGRSFQYSFKLAGTVFTVFRQLFTGSLGIGSLGGTVTTIGVTANAIKTGGFWSLLNISAFIGVNLAVFNLLPFPALDGSRAVFVIIEWIRKKPLNRRVEGIIHTVGFLLIILFAVFIDLQRCF